MIRGVVGRIDWLDYPAAAINGYVVTPLAKDRARWSLTATVVLSNAFNLSQRPLTFIAQLKRQNGSVAEWRWPVESLSTETRNGVPTLVAQLGREQHDVPIRPPVERRSPAAG